MDHSQRDSNPEAAAEQDPFVPGIIQSLRSRGHLAGLPPRVKAWERRKITGFDPLKAKLTYDRFQEFKALRLHSTGAELIDAYDDFTAALERFLGE